MRKILYTVPILAAAVAAPAQTGEVRIARSAFGAEARLVVDYGLVVTDWAGAPRGTLLVGHGSEPRFDGAGNLFFTRTFDDGHGVVRVETWRVDRGATRLRRLGAGDAAPPFVPIRPAAPLGAKVKVVVDAGHGGSDSGATGNGLLEKNVNLDVAKHLQQLLILDTQDTAGGGEWDVLMTRTADVFVSLSQRTTMANSFGARSFLSIHMNAFSSSSANGTETFCMTGQELNAGGRYRNRLQVEALAAWGLRDRGVKSANFYVLRNTSMPAALVEGGFVTSPIDSQKMKDEAAKQRLALGLLYATQEHHGFKRYTPRSTQTGTLRGIVYDAVRGTGARIPGAMIALQDGSFTFADSAGVFSFQLRPGSYRYAATDADFDSAELQRTVVANREVWGSLGLTPANVPLLVVPGATGAGTTFVITLRGDPFSPALLVIGGRPFLPLLRLQGLGLGTVWPDLTAGVVVGIGNVTSSGLLVASFRAPKAPGLVLHMQALVQSRSRFRLSNGGALRVQ